MLYSDKVRIASILRVLASRTIHFIPILYKPKKMRQNFCENPRVFYHISRLLHSYDFLCVLPLLKTSLTLLHTTNMDQHVGLVGTRLNPNVIYLKRILVLQADKTRHRIEGLWFYEV